MAEEISVLRARIDALEAVRGANKFNQATDSMKQGAVSTNRSLSALKSTLARVFSIYAGYRVLKASTMAMAEQERVIAQLNAGLESTNGISGQTVDGIREVSIEMQRSTGIANEMVEEVAAIGLSFTNITGDVFPEFLRISADVSTRMGTDLKSTSIQLAKALNDPVANLGALSRAGIQFSADQKEVIKTLWESGQQMEAQKIILAELETQYGGSAKAARNTLGGAMKALKEELSDLGKNLGYLFTGKNQAGLESFIELLQKLNDTIANNPIAKSGGLTGNLQSTFDFLYYAIGDPELAAGLKKRRAMQRNIEARKNQQENIYKENQILLSGNETAVPEYYMGVEDRASDYRMYNEEAVNESILQSMPKELSIIEKSMQRIGDASQQFGNQFRNAMEEAVFSGKGLREVLQGLEQDILRLVFRQTVSQPIANALSSGIQGMFGTTPEQVPVKP